MELYIKIDTEYKKCSLFGDEEIEITRSWGTDNMLNNYGSYSKTFSIPADANNSNIFKNYSFIGTTTINPNILYDAMILINGYEILGNIQIQGFSNKSNKPYSYNLVFYGTENNLMKLINVDMNSVPLSEDFNFQFNIENVVNTWTGDTKVFVPIMASKRPFTYRDEIEINNINSAYSGKDSGVSMKDLIVSYNMIDFLGNMFSNFGVILNTSSGITSNWNNLYICPNIYQGTSSGTCITNIHFRELSYDDVSLYNPLRLHPPGYDNPSDARWLANGILNGTNDFVSWDNIYDYFNSTNKYLAPYTGFFNFNIDFEELDYNLNWYEIFDNIVFIVKDETNLEEFSFTTITNKINEVVSLELGHSYSFRFTLRYFVGDTLYEKAFVRISGSLFIDLKNIIDVKYDYKINKVQYPNITFKDFFVDLCKTYNYFYEYKLRYSEFAGYVPVVYLYTFNELEKTTYDLSEYFLINDYSYNNEPKYKIINYKFKEGKDINNIAYKQGIINGDVYTYDGETNYGELYANFSYDVGIDKLSYISRFSTFPYTLLNKTDSNNQILATTDIPLHSELNESLTPVQSDFLLFYKDTMKTGITYKYNLQSSLTGYTEMDYVSDYDVSNVDFNVISNKLFSDNNKKRFETQLDFILPFNILYNIKVYDIVIVNGVYYEIKEYTMNMKTGYTKIKLITI